MKNIEKYKDEIKAELKKNKTLGCVVNKLMGNTCDGFPKCNDCYLKVLDWLLQEYEEPILDDIEIQYLKNVIEPFRDYVAYVIKFATSKLDFLSIYISVNEEKVRSFEIPLMYDLDSMFKNIKYDERYTLEELGL